jgi:tetratricopeptide (TPR) repeat protein
VFYAIPAVRSERWDEAIALYEEALAARPDHVPLLYNLACTESLAGRLDDALQHLQQAVALEPGRAGNAQTEADFDAIRSLPGFPGR